MKHQRASILIGLLWCLALLSVVVVGVLHMSRMDLLTVKNHGDRIQAHYLALAGVERTKALIYHDYITRRQSGKNHDGQLYDDAKDFENFSLGRGRFQVYRPARPDENGRVIYGIGDEESRLNINTAFAGELTNITGISPNLADSIVAWRSDKGEGATGAGADYYGGLQPPYVPRNGPFQTVRELLMVRDVPRDELLGDGADNNNYRDGADRPASAIDSGWAALLTANSTEKNLDAFGKERVNIQGADESALTGISGVSSDVAKAIVAYRGKKSFQSIVDLLDVTNSPPGHAPGQKMIDQNLFMQIADSLSISGDADVAGMININTAGVDVLSCLPGLDRATAQAIVSYRQSNGFFDNIAGLLRVGGVSADIFRPIAPLLTARSETFRITCEGRVNSSGAAQRIQAIVHVASHEMTTLAYREDL